MKTELSGTHWTTYKTVFQHPVARNLHWVALHSMLVALADGVEDHADTLKITRNSKTLVLHRPTRKGLDDIEELMKVRHFLTRSGAVAAQSVADGLHLLVVIDHREARIYRTEIHGAVPRCIKPYDAFGTGRYLHYVQDKENGQRRPEEMSFYESVSSTLRDAEKILLFGSGTGASSAMEQLVVELKKNHAEIAKRIVGAVTVNEHHLTENELLAKAREFYATLPPSQSKDVQSTDH